RGQADTAPRGPGIRQMDGTAVRFAILSGLDQSRVATRVRGYVNCRHLEYRQRRRRPGKNLFEVAQRAAFQKIEEVTMASGGLQRMLDFLNFLKEKKIHFYLEQQDEDGIRVTLTLVGLRVEVAFTVDHMTFSVFKGKEDVMMDKDMLFNLIKENWD